MDFKISFVFDCTDRFGTVLNEALKALASSNAQATQARRKTTEKKPKELPLVAEEAAPAVEKEEERVPKPAAEIEAEAPQAEAEETKEETGSTFISDADLRAAIADCRKRIIGDDPSTNKELHRKINLALKERVKAFGANNSTELPQDKRAEFIFFAQSLTLDDNGEPVPF